MALRVSTLADRGRALVAAQSLRAGQVVLQESPLLIYVEAEAAVSGLFCGHCLRVLPPVGFAICPSCIKVRFCSSACHHHSLKSHTPWACSALSRLSSFSAEMNLEMQTQIRFLIAVYNLAASSPSCFHKILQMDGQGEAAGSVVEIHAFMEGIFLNYPLQLVQGFQALTIELTACLLAKDKRNAFGMMAPLGKSGERKVRAYALYERASLFNHDCLPNACRFDYIDNAGEHNTDIFIRMLDDIPEGREVCLSYFPVNLTYTERQKCLLEDYGFQCKCQRCEIEEQWSDDEKGKQPGCSMAEEKEEEENEMGSDDDMDDNSVEEMQDDKDDFPHAMFFVKYLCPIEGCGGTMAPLSPETGSVAMECNMCGHMRSEEEFLQDLNDHHLME